jgi:hypothetical protein
VALRERTEPPAVATNELFFRAFALSRYSGLWSTPYSDDAPNHAVSDHTGAGIASSRPSKR